jgi:hypothetical protein
MILLLILSILLIMVALGILTVSVLSLASQGRKTVRTGVESVVRLKEVVAGIRDEELRLRNNVVLLSESARGWSRVTALTREAQLLVHSLRRVGTATALLSTLRRISW